MGFLKRLYFVKIYSDARSQFKTNIPKLLILFFCTSAYSANIFFQVDIDDFSDEERISLVFYEDSNNDFFERYLIIQCDQGNLGLMIQNGIFFSISDYLDIKMRFDKNTPLEFSFMNIDNVVVTVNKSTVTNFLNDARTANNLVIKIEDNDHIMRFTDFSRDQDKIIQFIERVQPIPGCEI